MIHEERPPAPVRTGTRRAASAAGSISATTAASAAPSPTATTAASPRAAAAATPPATRIPRPAPRVPPADPARTRTRTADLSAAAPEVVEELRRLRARVPRLRGVLVATTDGLVLAHDELTDEPESLAALTAAALGVAQRLVDTTGRGALRELMVRGAGGCVATYAAGRAAVLTVVADQDATVGLLHLEARRAGAGIGDLVDGALDRAETP